VAALLVGLKPEMCKPELVGLVGRDTETGATWPFPPTLFLSVQLDHAVILLNMRHTIAYFLARVRPSRPHLPPPPPPGPPLSTAYLSLALRTCSTRGTPSPTSWSACGPPAPHSSAHPSLAPQRSRQRAHQASGLPALSAPAPPARRAHAAAPIHAHAIDR